jgi:hypothetical protein
MNNAELGCQWHFAESIGGTDQGPTTDAKAEYFKKSPFPSLIRESIQNALDARDDINSPVIVEYKFSSLSSRNFKDFFKLKDHINGIFNLFPEQSVHEKYDPMLGILSKMQMNSQTIDYLQISDYNTCGMDYNSAHGNETGPFYAFARCIGYNLKSSDISGGSFGLGKEAIFKISPLNTVLVSTLTKTGKYFFEGVSSLCTHKIGRKKYRETGYYDNNGGKPISNKEMIPNRFRRDKVGTDLFLMGIDGTQVAKSIEAMVKAVLRNFWLAIIHDKLIVNISDNKAADSAISINSETIDSLMLKHFPSEVDFKKRDDMDYNPRPYYDAVVGDRANKRYKKIRKCLPSLGDVVLYLNKDKNSKDRVVYMNSIELFVFSKLTQTDYGFSGVFECLSKQGQIILKKFENVAHCEWDYKNYRDSGTKEIKENAKAIRDEYENFIIQSINNEFISVDNTPLEIMGAEEFLYMPEELIDNDNDSESWNLAFGKETGDVSDDENAVSITSSVNHDKLSYSDTATKNHGSVMIPVETNAQKDESDDQDDNLLLGGKKGTGEGHKEENPVHGDNLLNENPDGEKGTYRRQIKVVYRALAQKIDDDIVHTIFIHTKDDIANGEIEISTIGEDSGEIFSDIIKTQNGIISTSTINRNNKEVIVKNRIIGLSFKPGANKIEGVQFVDNFKHVLTIKAYENK